MSTKTANSKTTAEKAVDKKAPKCDVAKVKTGSVFSRHSFGIVKGKTGYDKVTVENTNEDSWQVDEGLLAKEFSFADQFEEEKEVSRTDAIDALMAHPFMAMTVHFNKQPKPEDVAEALKAGQGAMNEKDWKKHVETLMAGEPREIIGYHFGSLDPHRRLQFFEIDSKEGAKSRMKLVDPRTVNWLVVDRIKYVVK
jgi:hypothetical protein